MSKILCTYFCLISFLILPLKAAVALGDVVLIGDSTTHGALTSAATLPSFPNSWAGYRYEFWKDLVEAGADFTGTDNDLVGRQTGVQNVTGGTPPTLPDVMGQVFDDHHEGFGGATTATIDSNIADFLLGETPDVALILLGVNDVSLGVNAATTRTNMESIISKLVADNANIDIYLGSVLETAGHADNMLIADLNVIYQDIATNNASVTYVDLSPGFDTSLHLVDSVHFNADGDRIVAQNFAAVVVPEPSTVLFLLSGAGMLLRRRRA